MARRFLVDTPDMLLELKEFVKEGDVSRVASVWNVTRRKKGARRWDGKIMVSFYTEEKKRIASLFRLTAAGVCEEFAKLKYTQALDWCKTNLHGTD